MRFNRNEEEFILLLARVFEKGPHLSLSRQECMEHLIIDEGELDRIVIRLKFVCDNGLFVLSSSGIHPLPGCVEIAREIEDRRQAPPEAIANRVKEWCRRTPVIGHLVGLHPIVGVVGGIVGLIGGILGLIAWLR